MSWYIIRTPGKPTGGGGFLGLQEGVSEKDTSIRAMMLWHWSKEKVSPGGPEEGEDGSAIEGGHMGTKGEPAGL